MTQVRTAAVLACATLLAACTTDYATFVTSTDIGINADTKTETLNLGYVRTELFVGPGYPDQGAALPAVGYLDTNLNAFSPKINQLYATGVAADLVTQPVGTLSAKEPPPSYSGDRRALLFGTGSNLGLKIGFTGNGPSSIKFGFNREELSIIPLRRNLPTVTTPDSYAPVLASIHMDQTATDASGKPTDLSGTKVQLTQFFATGVAAKNLASNDRFRQYFADQAALAVAASSDAAVQQSIALQKSDLATISSYFDKFANDFAGARKKLVDAAGLTNMPVVGPALNNVATKAAFMDYLQKNETLIPRIAPFAAKLSA